MDTWQFWKKGWGMLRDGSQLDSPAGLWGYCHWCRDRCCEAASSHSHPVKEEHCSLTFHFMSVSPACNIITWNPGGLSVLCRNKPADCISKRFLWVNCLKSATRLQTLQLLKPNTVYSSRSLQRRQRMSWRENSQRQESIHNIFPHRHNWTWGERLPYKLTALTNLKELFFLPKPEDANSKSRDAE